jgi:anti-sigma factor (TIGR02949 family)
MANCRDVCDLLTPYLDSEIEAADRAAVEGHLRACPPCARRAAAEGAARKVVMVRAASLAVAAPESLRRRCDAMAPKRLAAPRWAVSGWRVRSLSAVSLAVVVIAAGVAYGVAVHSPTLLAAELAMDHVKCFALFEPRVGEADPAAVATQLQADYGWRLAIPAGLPREHLRLLGARRCVSTDGQVAHVLYRHGAHALSLFMMPGTAREPARVALAGHVARIWSSGATTLILVGSETDAEIQPVAAYFQSARF